MGFSGAAARSRRARGTGRGRAGEEKPRRARGAAGPSSAAAEATPAVTGRGRRGPGSGENRDKKRDKKRGKKNQGKNRERREAGRVSWLWNARPEGLWRKGGMGQELQEGKSSRICLPNPREMGQTPSRAPQNVTEASRRLGRPSNRDVRRVGSASAFPKIREGAGGSGAVLLRGSDKGALAASFCRRGNSPLPAGTRPGKAPERGKKSPSQEFQQPG